MCGGSCGSGRGWEDRRHSRSPSPGWAVSARSQAAHGREGRSGPQPPLGWAGEGPWGWLRRRARLVVVICGIWLVRCPVPHLSRASPPWALLAGAVLGLAHLPLCCADGRLGAVVVVVVRADGISVLASIGGDLGCVPLRCPRHARRPAGRDRPPETVFGFCGCTGAGLALTGAAEPPASLRMALL